MIDEHEEIEQTRQFPEWWIMRPWPHWSAEQNKRIRFVRLDGPTDHLGHYPSHYFDGKLQIVEKRIFGTRGTELLRRCRPTEIPVNLFTVNAA